LREPASASEAGILGLAVSNSPAQALDLLDDHCPACSPPGSSVDMLYRNAAVFGL
jgi:hypothetical protein